MYEDTKQLLIVVIGLILLASMSYISCNVDHYLRIKEQNCENVSKYNNTLQHDINLETVCK